MAEWVGIAITAMGIVITAVLTGAAIYYGNNLRRRTRAEVEARVAEKRLPAYAALWEKTKIASPMRDSPLAPDERSELFDSLTDWYYDSGHGMLLTEATRNIYLKAKANLTCPAGKLVPASLRDRAAEGDAARGWASIDQLSLLRTSMRADVEIFTQPYDEELSADDVAFLEACKVDLNRPPWRDAVRRKSVQRDAWSATERTIRAFDAAVTRYLRTMYRITDLSEAGRSTRRSGSRSAANSRSSATANLRQRTTSSGRPAGGGSRAHLQP